jgi:hypothetical protein
MCRIAAHPFEVIERVVGVRDVREADPCGRSRRERAVHAMAERVKQIVAIWAIRRLAPRPLSS